MISLICALLLSVTTGPEGTDWGGSWLFWSDSKPEKKVVSLPHDAMLSERRDPLLKDGSATGYFPGGVYHYEKAFNAPPSWLESHVVLHFDGVYRHSEILLNGKKIAFHANGYTPFDVCLDGALRSGENCLQVNVDNSSVPHSRWYSGAGIYRPVRLTIQPREHVRSVRITTLSTRPARIAVDIAHNGSKASTEIYLGDCLVAGAEGDHAEMIIPDARLWSADHPDLYRAVVRVGEDQQETEFGIRDIHWSSSEGLLVNGERVLLKGGCLHHDNGILGAAEYEEAAFRRVALLKSFGFNAVRSSHNPASSALLKACDRLGMYVMDESWDMWFNHKNEYDYASDWLENYLQDLAEMVEHDYNHPSVIMYSIGNELSEPATQEGMGYARNIIREMHLMDPSRPVTAGINLLILYMSAKEKNGHPGQGVSAQSLFDNAGVMSSQQYNQLIMEIGDMTGKAILSEEAADATAPILDALDIAGYNYGSARYPLEGHRYPNRIIVGSETFPQDLPTNWKMVEEYPYLIGDFMWTAWDYLGEAGVGAWSFEDDAKGFDKPYPWLLADAGAFDITGQPGGEAFWARTIWSENKEKPFICVSPIEDGELIKAPWRGTDSRPSWSWRGCEGKKAQVEVFSSAPEIILRLNGRKVGRKRTRNGKADFEIPYKSGKLKATACYGPLLHRSSSLHSATGRLGIAILPEENSVPKGALLFVNIDIVGQNGIRESKADATLTVHVEGGELLGFGSARPRTEESFLKGRYTTYYGHSQAVIRAGNSGSLTVTVHSDTYPTETKTIQIK